MPRLTPQAFKRKCRLCARLLPLFWFLDGGRNKTCEECLGHEPPSDDQILVKRPRRSRRWWPQEVVDQKGEH